jgi:hypothetical protein
MDLVNAALASGNQDVIEGLTSRLALLNNLGCPIDVPK